MSWKRGLLRLWVLASFLWIVGASALLRADTVVADYMAKTSDHLSITETPGGPWLKYREEYSKLTPTQRVALANTRQREARDRLLGLLAFLIVPSLAAYAVGIGGTWVWRGFEKAEK